VIFWLIPLANICLFQIRWHNIAIVLILGFLWFFGLVIYKAGIKMSSEILNIIVLKEDLKISVRNFYKIVAAVPLIGKRKKPFKAFKLRFYEYQQWHVWPARAEWCRKNNPYEDYLRLFLNRVMERSG